AAGHQLEGPRLDLLAGSGHSDDDGGTPATMAALESLTHQIDVTNTLEAVVGTAVSQLHEVRHQVALHLLRIDEVRHPELLGHRLALRIDIDADDLVGPGQPGTLDDVQADAPKTEYDDVRSRLDLRRFDDGADTRGDSTADVTNFLERRILADLGHRDL